MRQPASIPHRLLALLLLLAVLASTALVIIPVRNKLSTMDQRIADDFGMIQRLRAGAVSIEIYDEAIASIEAAVRDDARFLNAESPALASAALQQIIRQSLEDAGATLRSVQDVPAGPTAPDSDTQLPPRPVTVRATVLAKYPDFLRAIARIEATKPYLFVDQLSIRTTLNTDPATEWQPMTIRFDVTAFMPPTVSVAQ